MKKIIVILIVFVLFLFACEISTYYIFKNKHIAQVSNTDFNLPSNFNYQLKYRLFSENFKEPIFFQEDISFGQNHKILLLGCSFAYGAQLQKNQTFQYKLAQNKKATVYNRSFPGWGVQHMYFQLMNPNYDILGFPNDLDTVIYVYMPDHINRLHNFYWGSVFDNIYNVRYELKNGKLVERKIIFPFIDMLFISKSLRNIQIQYLKKHTDYQLDSESLILSLFKESYIMLSKKYPKAKFFIFEYGDRTLKKYSNEFLHLGWHYYSLEDILPKGVSLNDEDYHFQNDPHPNAKAWDVVINALDSNGILY